MTPISNSAKLTRFHKIVMLISGVITENVYLTGKISEEEALDLLKVYTFVIQNLFQLLSEPKHSQPQSSQNTEQLLNSITRAVLDAAKSFQSIKPNSEVIDTASGRIRLHRLAEFVAEQFPSINTRIGMYLDHKLLSSPPLQYSPQWSDKTELSTFQIVSLVNPLLSPIKRYHSVFCIYNSAYSGFEFTRLGSFSLSQQLGYAFIMGRC